MKQQMMEYSRQWLRWCSRMIHVPATILFFVLSAQAQPTITAASNPVVVPNGQASGTTTTTWQAAPDYTYSEIYLSVDNAEWSEFARGGDSSKPATVKLGSSYTFRMMIYEGQQGTPRIITTLTVTAIQGNPPPPAGGSGGGVVIIGPVGKDKDPGAVYRDSFTGISNVRVEPGPNHLIIRFHGPPNQVPYVSIGRGAAIKRNGEWIFGDNLVGGGFVSTTVSAAEKATGDYTFASAFGTTISNDGLESGRTYYYIITVPGGNGRSYQDTGKFTMRQEAITVRVVWDKVLILDDSDDLSTGEIQFWFWANYGQPGGKITQYANGDADSGHEYTITGTRTVTINNAPNLLTLSASGLDNDCTFAADLGDAPAPYNGPGKSECGDWNVAKDTFDLSKYADNATVSFILNTMPGGALKYVIFGYFEIRRTTVGLGSSGNSKNTGTSSSGLKLERPVIKGVGRVKVTSGTPAPPVSICDAAREARERNSPAAAGLEAQCVNNLAVRGAAIAQSDPVVAQARAAQLDAQYRLGFDIATGIFGNPALGAQGNTALGPGSLKIRDALSAIGQRGFNASVQLHLSRKY